MGLVVAVGGTTRNPTLRTPEIWAALTSTGMLRPVDATAPVTGARSTTRSAATFTRKITSVSSVKLPAPSVARPMIVISPPAPEVGGNVTVTPRPNDVTVVLKMVSVTAR